ncbi:hypothetical protein HPB48_022414 [Haemaphysalis longicornis]|uniref:CCHC-type domain-containing protein n=1 Tax=Haemaphysalis longicornis TaxID=44386 RepID=A0A9J6GDL3_HAELO|nr:hypothetical protein HPB48_022414 [Haemaphysalis longicornis]
MALATAARPLVFCGVVPRGVSTTEVGKALLQRFTLMELHGVQDFLGRRTEILFKTQAAVEKMLANPRLTVGEHKLQKAVRVSSYPMDASDDHLKCALGAYRQVSEVRREMRRAVPGLATGVRYVRLDMAQPVPNFLGIGRYVVQCEYEGVLRVCRRCNGSGHMAADCKALQCSRCGLFDAHEVEACERSCLRCGGHHPIAKCSRPSFAQALTSYRPVPPQQLHKAAVHWQMDATRSNLDSKRRHWKCGGCDRRVIRVCPRLSRCRSLGCSSGGSSGGAGTQSPPSREWRSTGTPRRRGTSPRGDCAAIAQAQLADQSTNPPGLKETRGAPRACLWIPAPSLSHSPTDSPTCPPILRRAATRTQSCHPRAPPAQLSNNRDLQCVLCLGRPIGCHGTRRGEVLLGTLVGIHLASAGCGPGGLCLPSLFPPPRGTAGKRWVLHASHRLSETTKPADGRNPTTTMRVVSLPTPFGWLGNVL